MMQHIAAGCQCVMTAVRPTHLPRRRSRPPAAAQSFPAERAGRPPLHSRHVSGGQWTACTLQATSRCSFPILRGSTQGRPGAGAALPTSGKGGAGQPKHCPPQQRGRRANHPAKTPPLKRGGLAAGRCTPVPAVAAGSGGLLGQRLPQLLARPLQLVRLQQAPASGAGGGGGRVLCLRWAQAQRSGPRGALCVPAAHLRSAAARSAVAGPRSSLVHSWVELLKR